MPLPRGEPTKFALVPVGDVVTLKKLDHTTGLPQITLYTFSYLDSVKEMHRVLGEYLVKQARDAQTQS